MRSLKPNTLLDQAYSNRYESSLVATNTVHSILWITISTSSMNLTRPSVKRSFSVKTREDTMDIDKSSDEVSSLGVISSSR